MLVLRTCCARDLSNTVAENIHAVMLSSFDSVTKRYLSQWQQRKTQIMTVCPVSTNKKGVATKCLRM